MINGRISPAVKVGLTTRCYPTLNKQKTLKRERRVSHGKGGDLNVTYSRTNYPLGETYVEAAKAAGYPYNADFNGEKQEGVGYFQINQKGGQRWSSAKAFLTEAAQRSNLTIATQSKVMKILFHNNARAVGVEYLNTKGEVIQAAAMHEVIVCAGAFASPQLLELSGIGRRDILEKNGIDLVKELPGVGENLQDHFTIMVQHGVKGGPTLNRDGRFPWIILSLLKYLFAKRGVLAHPAATIGAFLRGTQKNGGADTRPTYQIHFAAGNGAFDEKGNMVPGKFPGVTSTACMLRPESRGWVHIKSADPLQWPAVQYHYLSTEEDRRRSIEAIKIQRRIYASSVFQSAATEEQLPGAHVQTDEQILEYCRSNGHSVYHPVGTCKMGAATDASAVVDRHLKVHGLEALRVVDASIFPNLTSGNTHAPVLMAAERAAEWILEDKRLAERDKFQGLPPKGVTPAVGAASGGKCPFGHG